MSKNPNKAFNFFFFHLILLPYWLSFLYGSFALTCILGGVINLLEVEDACLCRP